MAKKPCNILILGETGVGKSTFINAFANYIYYPTLNDALEATNIKALIPSKFTVTDSNFNSREVSFGADKNETFETGQSSTQSCRTYSFTIDNTTVRLIDTPGIGDTRGVEKDHENFENLLVYLGRFEQINGIVIMLKPNESRVTVLFDYCIKQLLSSLERSAVNNILFLFTNARGTFYKPGETIGPLKAVLKEIQDSPPNVLVPFGQENTFCLDNEAFRFLLLTRQGHNFFNDAAKESFHKSWDIFAQVSKRLLQYVSNLKPHLIQNTISLVNAKRVIAGLRKPLGEIIKMIEDNISMINFHKKQLSDSAKTRDEKKKLLYVPKINMKIVNLKDPQTVCTHNDCTDNYNIEGQTAIHYKTVCHSPCYLEKVKETLIGDRILLQCRAMRAVNNVFTCTHCGHSYHYHMHIYYKSELYKEEVKNTNVEKDIVTEQQEMEKIEKALQTAETNKIEYEREKMMIQKTVAKFAHFLNNSSIIVYNDAYKGYVEYLIEREKSHGEQDRQNVIDKLQNIIEEYEREKNILTEELEKRQKVDPNVNTVVTASDVMNGVKELFNLRNVGKTIKEMFEAQQQLSLNEISMDTEIIIEPSPAKKKSNGNTGYNAVKWVVASFLLDNKDKLFISKKSTTE